MQMITEDPTPPTVTSLPPSAPVGVDSRLSITFSQRMEPQSTEAAFGISPSISVNISWTDNGRTMRIQPAALLPFDSSFTVTIGTSAKNFVGIGLDLDDDTVYADVYSFTFSTVERDS